LAAAFAERHCRNHRATIRTQTESTMRTDLIALAVRPRLLLFPEEFEDALIVPRL
jgi:hypothetical protein